VGVVILHPYLPDPLRTTLEAILHMIVLTEMVIRHPSLDLPMIVFESMLLETMIQQ
jgi:hypothetical protein